MQELTFLQDYQDYLERAGRSSHTVKAYTQDLAAFARWYEHTTGEALSGNNDNPFRTIERQDVGVQLEVQPQINDGDTIQLRLRQEVSSVIDVVGPTLGELVTSKREIETVALADNGEIIVIGGGVSKAGDLLFEPARATVRARCMAQDYWRDTPIVPAALGDDVGLMGAIALVLSQEESVDRG